MKNLRIFTLFLPLLLLSACIDDEVPLPVPRALTVDAVGFYCNMTVKDHPGPKGQIHQADSEKPLWFSSVRDAVAFTMLPDETKDIAAIYVHDMGGGRDWKHPSDDSWIEARDAWFVIHSRRRGGMGLTEAVPFAHEGEALAFTDEYGGRVVPWHEIPHDYILNAGVPNHDSDHAEGNAVDGTEGKHHDG